MQDDLDTLIGEVRRLRRKPGYSNDTEQYVSEVLREITPIIERLQSDGAREDYVLSYVSQAASGTIDYNNELCTCRSINCPIKDGRIPGTISRSDNINTGLRKWRMPHRGEPLVLDQALEAWTELRANVRDALEQCMQALKQDEPPDSRPENHLAHGSISTKDENSDEEESTDEPVNLVGYQ